MSLAVNHAGLAKGRGLFTVMQRDRKVAAIREDGTVKECHRHYIEITSEQKPLRLKIRSICGDETVWEV